MDWLTVVLLLVFGLLFLIVEVLFIPGTTLLGLLGFALLVAGVWLGYRDLGTTTGDYALAASVVAAGTMLYIGLRPKNLHKFALTTVNDSQVRDVRRPDVQPGTIGRALSALRPAGTILFGNERREATTRGEFLDAGTDVRVLRIEQNRIVVEQA